MLGWSTFWRIQGSCLRRNFAWILEHTQSLENWSQIQLEWMFRETRDAPVFASPAPGLPHGWWKHRSSCFQKNLSSFLRISSQMPGKVGKPSKVSLVDSQELTSCAACSRRLETHASSHGKRECNGPLDLATT